MGGPGHAAICLALLTPKDGSIETERAISAAALVVGMCCWRGCGVCGIVVCGSLVPASGRWLPCGVGLYVSSVMGNKGRIVVCVSLVPESGRWLPCGVGLSVSSVMGKGLGRLGTGANTCSLVVCRYVMFCWVGWGLPVKSWSICLSVSVSVLLPRPPAEGGANGGAGSHALQACAPWSVAAQRMQRCASETLAFVPPCGPTMAV